MRPRLVIFAGSAGWSASWRGRWPTCRSWCCCPGAPRPPLKPPLRSPPPDGRRHRGADPDLPGGVLVPGAGLEIGVRCEPCALNGEEERKSGEHAAPGALAIWEASANPALLTRRIAWPELVEFSQSANGDARTGRSLLGCRPHFRRGGRRTQGLVQHSAAARPPGYGLKCGTAKPRATWRPIPTTPLPQRCPDSCGRQAASHRRPSAARRWAGEEVSRYGHDNGLDRPEALIIVPRRELAAPVRAWLAGEELHADVLTPAEARTCVPYQAVLLVGHPGYTYASPWRQPDIALRCFGWLLTAPPATTVHIALPGDTPALDQNATWLLPGDEHPRPRSADPGPPPSARRWGAPALTARIVHPVIGTADIDTILAAPVSLAGQASVYYHPQLGPRPHSVLLDDDTDALRITATTVPAVRPGMLLVLRVGLAEHTELVERADRWLAERRGWSSDKISAARQLVAAIKTVLATARLQRGRATVQRDLASHGVDYDYARVLAINPLDEYYICPQRRTGYLALLRALSLERHDAQFEVLAAVRTAHQQAGEEIRRYLLARLTADRAWVEQVDEQGWAGVRANGRGCLLLAVVTAVGDTILPVPRTLLGVPLDQAGRRIRRLPETGGER